VIANGDAMSVPAQITKYLSRPAESRLGVNDPVLPKQSAKKGSETFGMCERLIAAGELNPLTSKRAFEPGYKLASEDPAEDLNGQEKRVSAPDPLFTIWRKPARWNNTVQMRMEQQVLPPRMQDGEKTDTGPEVFGVRSNLQHRLRHASEQKIVKETVVVSAEWVELVWQRKDDMEVSHFQQVLLPCHQPAFARLRLTLGAVPVAAGVIRDGRVIAAGTDIDVTAQCHRATPFHGT
jgi:hypothetical protein